jgi:hypothetical protein
MKQRLWRLVDARMFRKGVLGGNRNWLALWVAVAVTRFVHRRLNGTSDPERITLGPGESLLVSDTGQTWGQFEAGERA